MSAQFFCKTCGLRVEYKMILEADGAEPHDPWYCWECRNMMKKHWKDDNRDACFSRWWNNVTKGRVRQSAREAAKAAWDAAWVTIIELEQPTKYEAKEQ